MPVAAQRHTGSVGTPQGKQSSAQLPDNTLQRRLPDCWCQTVLVPVLLQIGYAMPLQWWLVFLPQWIGHAGHVCLVVFVLASVVSDRLQACMPCQHTVSAQNAGVGQAQGVLKKLCVDLQEKLVQQQLGPMPPATASPGMILQYNTMLSERKRSLVVDNINGLIENAAALLVKVRSTVRAVQDSQMHLALNSNCSHSS